LVIEITDLQQNGNAPGRPFQRTVTSADIQSAKEVQSKQILFYPDLVHCHDLPKLFTVLDKTPSSTSLSICRERIKMDLNKIILYEEELSHLYALVDRVAEYFKLINFEADSSIKNETVKELIDPSPLIGRTSFQLSPKGPKLINFSTKAVGAKEAYKEFLRNKSHEFG
jgi:hypothetical protein